MHLYTSRRLTLNANVCPPKDLGSISNNTLYCQRVRERVRLNGQLEARKKDVSWLGDCLSCHPPAVTPER
jgi:hypothetical protein